MGYYEKRPTAEELRQARRRLLVRLLAVVVAAVAVLATITLTTDQEAGAADSNPPVRRVSDPGNYPLHGVHGSRISRTIVTSAGSQYRKRNGVYEYRPRWAVQGNGRLMKVLFKDLSFYRHGFDEFRRCQSGCVIYGERVVLVGRWRRVYGGEDWSTDGNVQATYLLGPTSGLHGFGSYRMRAPGRYPVAGPTFW